MSLRENLKSIEVLNRRSVRMNNSARDRVVLNYNEMTFIPYLSEHASNRQIENTRSIAEVVHALAAIVKFVKNTDLQTLTDVNAVALFSRRFSIKKFNNDKLDSQTGIQAEINAAWIDLYSYGLPNTNKKTPSIINAIENQCELINETADQLNTKFKEFGDFFETYSALIAQLPKSLLHEEDKNYVIDYIHKYTASMPDINQLVSISDTYHDLNKAFLTDIKQHINDIAPNTFISQADAFILKEIEHQKNNSVENFLTTKLLSEDLKARLEFTAAQPIQNAYLFSDNSIAYKKDNQYHTIKDNEHLISFIVEIYTSSLSYTLRKKPKTIPFFMNKIKEDNSLSNAVKAAISFIEHSQVLKQYDFDLNNFTDKSFEAIDDSINKIVNKNKVKQFANSILSAKYKHHFNEETEPYFKELYDNDVTTSQLQTFVGKKLAALSSNEDVIKMINGMLDHFNGFTVEALTEKLDSMGIKKLQDKDNVVTFEVVEYEHCKALGSTSWCIVRDEDYFNQYAKEGNNRQYITYDFNKISTDIQSMIGFTVYGNGEIYAEHWKDDSSISSYNKPDSLVLIQTNAVYQNKERHTLLDQQIANMEDLLNIKDTKNTKQKMRMA